MSDWIFCNVGILQRGEDFKELLIKFVKHEITLKTKLSIKIADKLPFSNYHNLGDNSSKPNENNYIFKKKTSSSFG